MCGGGSSLSFTGHMPQTGRRVIRPSGRCFSRLQQSSRASQQTTVESRRIYSKRRLCLQLSCSCQDQECNRCTSKHRSSSRTVPFGRVDVGLEPGRHINKPSGRRGTGATSKNPANEAPWLGGFLGHSFSCSRSLRYLRGLLVVSAYPWNAAAPGSARCSTQFREPTMAGSCQASATQARKHFVGAFPLPLQRTGMSFSTSKPAGSEHTAAQSQRCARSLRPCSGPLSSPALLKGSRRTGTLWLSWRQILQSTSKSFLIA